VSNAFGGPDRNGNVLKFTPDGVGSVFAENCFQLAFGLAFDSAGNLYVSNYNSSTIKKFSSTGVDLGVFAGSPGVNLPHGLLFDNAGNLYVANNGNSTIEKFSSTGVDLGVFAHTGAGPHFMTMFRPTGIPHAVLPPPGGRRVR
jgi:DNA-binding beta-propeller fold protein YncE